MKLSDIDKILALVGERIRIGELLRDIDAGGSVAVATDGSEGALFIDAGRSGLDAYLRQRGGEIRDELARLGVTCDTPDLPPPHEDTAEAAE